MEALDGVASYHMSGRRAVFVMESGERIDEETVVSVLEEHGLAFESLERLERPPVSKIVLADTGVT